MNTFLGRSMATEVNLLSVTLGLMLMSLACANSAFGSPSYCFNGAGSNNWECERSELHNSGTQSEYHSLKVVVQKQQDVEILEEILPIQRLGELQVPAGEHIIFLGKFRDSMKAHRVAERCRAEYPIKCARFSIQVITMGGDLDKVNHDLQNKASGDLVSTNNNRPELSRKTSLSASEDKPVSVVPRGLIKLADTLEYILWVDLRAGNLHVLQRDDELFRLARTMSISIGKAGYGKQKQGDKKTPIGVYRLLSYLTDEQLEDFYGSGAYTLNYPNALDKIKQRDGSGIWLHGLPRGLDHRPKQDSDGCVVLSNAMLDDIKHYVSSQHTTIVLDDQFEWTSSEEQEKRRAELEQAIEAWRSAWAKVDNDSYLAFYADDFTNLEKDLTAWQRYKRRIHRNKKFINIGISELSLLAYPSERNMVLARFYQRYESNNFRAAGWKEQLWRKEDSGQWRIVYERG